MRQIDAASATVHRGRQEGNGLTLCSAQLEPNPAEPHLLRAAGELEDAIDGLPSDVEGPVWPDVQGDLAVLEDGLRRQGR